MTNENNLLFVFEKNISLEHLFLGNNVNLKFRLILLGGGGVLIDTLDR